MGAAPRHEPCSLLHHGRLSPGETLHSRYIHACARRPSSFFCTSPTHLSYAILLHPIICSLSFSLAGCNAEGIATDLAEVYDFTTRQWTPLPNIPHRRAACNAAVVHRNKIYLIGGVNEKQRPQPAVDCFDIERRQWDEDFPNLPIGIVGPFIQLVEDKIYVIGGTNKKEPACNQSVVIDLDEKIWNPLPPKPTTCYACGGYLRNNKIYIIGGRDGQTPVQNVEVFDLETQQWENLAPMLSIRVFYSVMGVRDEIFALGGLVPMVGICKITEKYSIKENKWTRLKDMLDIRSDATHGIIGGRLVVAGGLGGQQLQAMNSVECISPRGKRFHRLPNLSKPRSSTSTLVFEGKLAAINGVGDGGIQKMVEVLSVKPKESKKED